MATRAPSPWRRVAGRGLYPVEYASWLISPLRRLLPSPERLISLSNAPGSGRIPEIGCGPGYFPPAASRPWTEQVPDLSKSLR